MKKQTVKTLSQVAFWAAAASAVISGGIFLADLIRGAGTSKRREGSLFVGLWAPSLFAISEMLDRISEQDKEFMGIPITEREPATSLIQEARDLIRR